jgi:hypothetical protein
MKQLFAASSLAVLTLFSTAAQADIVRDAMKVAAKLERKADQMRLAQMREDVRIQTDKTTLARVMVSRPVDLWNDQVKSAYCRLDDKQGFTSLVSRAVDSERKGVNSYISRAADSKYPGLAGQFEIAEKARFTYAGIVQDLNDKKVDLAQATNRADTAALDKKRTVRAGADAINCPTHL